MLEGIIIGFIVAVIIMAFIPAKKWPQPQPKHRRRGSSSHPPKALPWFDKDYLKRKEQEKKKYFWDD